jgi:hypothetical protein
VYTGRGVVVRREGEGETGAGQKAVESIHETASSCTPVVQVSAVVPLLAPCSAVCKAGVSLNVICRVKIAALTLHNSELWSSIKGRAVLLAFRHKVYYSSNII